MLGFLLGYYILEKEWIENACNWLLFELFFIHLTDSSKVSGGDVKEEKEVGQFIEQTDKPRQTGGP